MCRGYARVCGAWKWYLVIDYDMENSKIYQKMFSPIFLEKKRNLKSLKSKKS